MEIFGNLFGKRNDDDDLEWTQEDSDRMTARLEAVDRRIAEKQQLYGELCDACDQAQETIEGLETVIDSTEKSINSPNN